MSSAIRSLRFLPVGDSKDRQRYSDGEVFYDRQANTLRIYDGINRGGHKLATEEYVNQRTGGSSELTISAPPQATITSTFIPQLGAMGMTQIVNGYADDASTEVNLPFPVTFCGVAYNKIYITSNSQIIFDNAAGQDYSLYYGGAYDPESAIAFLPKPAIWIDGGDRSWKAVYTQTSGTTFRIRWEGSSSYSDVPINFIWELNFDSTTPAKFDLVIGPNSQSNGIQTSMITDGVTSLATFNAIAPFNAELSTSVFNSSTSAIKFNNTTVTQVGSTVEITPISNFDPTASRIAIGDNTGTQGRVSSYGIAIGSYAGYNAQGDHGISIGGDAGSDAQGNYAIAIGRIAGNTSQGTDAIAIGQGAGQNTQGISSVAIGAYAAQTNQPANSIVLNATGSALNVATTGLFVKPVRAVTSVPTGFKQVYYNPTTGEFVYLNV